MIYKYTWVYILRKGIFIRVDEGLLKRFNEVARTMGLTRSEAIRRAMETFIAIHTKNKTTQTRKVRGIVYSKFSLKELEEIYRVSR